MIKPYPRFQPWPAQLIRVGWVIGVPFKSAHFPVHGMKTIAGCTDPEYSPAIFKNRSHLIIDKTFGIVGIIQNTGECSVGLHPVKTTIIWFILVKWKTCSNPEHTFPVFIKCPDHITTQT